MDNFHPTEYLKRVISGEPELPPFMEILPVNPCNHRCVFCISSDYRMTRDRLPWSVMRRVITELGTSRKGAYLRFCGGGEPLLHPHAREMLLLSRESGLQTDLTTNGSLLKGELLEAAMQSCDLIRVSFNGGNEASYVATHRVSAKEYHRVLDNLRMIKVHPLRDRLSLELSCVICPENEDSLLDFLRLAARMEVDKAVLITETEARPELADRHVALAEQAVEQFEAPPGMKIRIRRSRPDTFIETDLPCAKVLFYGLVAADGDFYPSCHHVGMPEHRLGNLLEGSSIRQILSQPEVHEKRMRYLFETDRKLEKFVISQQNLNLVRDMTKQNPPGMAG